MERATPGTNRSTRRLILGTLAVLGFSAQALDAASIDGTDWLRPLASMSLPSQPALARSNAVRLLLQNFASNDVVKALIVAPGVIDDFHLVHRDAPPLRIEAKNLGEALVALTNQSPTRLLYTNSMLYWHTASDRVPAGVQGEITRSLSSGAKEERVLPRFVWIDVPWENIQPLLRKELRLSVDPAAKADEARHFERVNLAANGLSPQQLIGAVAATTGTRIVLRKQNVTFARP